MRSLRAASCPSTTPSWLMMPHRYISAMTSMIPEPQIPVTPVATTTASNPGSAGPKAGADDLESGLQRYRIDTHTLNRARRRPLTAADLGSLECRTCRARAGEQAGVVSQHHLVLGL